MGSLNMALELQTSQAATLPLFHKASKRHKSNQNHGGSSRLQKQSSGRQFVEDFPDHHSSTDMSKSYRSWTSNSSERSSSVPRVTYRRLEKIASYHYLPRVVYQGSLKKTKSQQNLPNKETSSPNNFLPMDEFGSLDSLTSVTTFSYIASREQREREEDIYEVKPSTITIRKERTVPKIADLLMNQFNQHHANHGTCIRCHRPKMLGR